MTRFAILESNSGFVWGVVDADSALSACAALDDSLGREDGRYEEVGISELRTTRGVYDVRTAPAGFDVDDGQDADAIAAVNAMPRAGVVAFIESD